MITLRNTEHIILIMHRHWAVLIMPVLSTIIFAIVPPIVLMVVANTSPLAIAALSSTLGFFALTILWLILVGVLLTELVYYWLDVWILTNERVIDIEQRGLFHREISEFGVENIQDVTVETPTLLATMLKFGTITIHTAGDKSFIVRDVPNADRTRELIITTGRAATHHGGTLQVGANQT